MRIVVMTIVTAAIRHWSRGVVSRLARTAPEGMVLPAALNPDAAVGLNREPRENKATSPNRTTANHFTHSVEHEFLRNLFRFAYSVYFAVSTAGSRL